MVKMLKHAAALLAVLFAVALAPVAAAPLAGQVPLMTGPIDPSNQLGNLNTLVQSINTNVAGTFCLVSGATPQTCNGQRGIATTNSLSTAAATDASYVINNSAVTATSQISCTDNGYSGTLVTNGYPVIMSCVPGSGTITVHITNTHASNALSGTVAIGFAVLN